ncbi:DM13 domain-containing protein [Arthrobacter sp. ISL-5]|uniref:DM13 domain-containing protein n=1 Tax=Arthrobacter sp. ISL-5 TaxID=2819111 RepID=UPI0020361DC0|nr:DM13 domain-containing protein [Arthrobacter sp. ISL-5]
MFAMKTGGRRRVWPIVVAGVAVVLLAIGFSVFKPWLLFVDVRVDEQIPTVAASPETAQPSPSASLNAPSPPAAAPTRQAPAGPVQVAVGSLISHEHTTTGTVRILRQPNGDRVLTLENLDTSNGPDVHVWLSAADVVEGTGGWFVAGGAEYFDLGLIKGNQGNQVYAIPAGVDLKKYKSVDLWCVQFSVSFGAAQLTF